MINNCTILVCDCETSSLSFKDGEIVQLASLAIEPRSLEIIEGSEFNSLLKPLKLITDDDWVKAQPAFDVNKKTREELEKAPHPKDVWNSFLNYVKKYSNGRGEFTAPILAGHNIISFDFPFMQELARQYGGTNNDGKMNIFNARIILDTMYLCWLWFDGKKEVNKYSLDFLRGYLGSTEEEKELSHDAYFDIKYTAKLLIRFLKLHRHFSPKIKFQNSFID